MNTRPYQFRPPVGSARVAEGPGFNVLIVKDGKMASPSPNALPGITRRTVFEIAETLGLDPVLRDVGSQELYETPTSSSPSPTNGARDGMREPLTVALRDSAAR